MGFMSELKRMLGLRGDGDVARRRTLGDRPRLRAHRVRARRPDPRRQRGLPMRSATRAKSLVATIGCSSRRRTRTARSTGSSGEARPRRVRSRAVPAPSARAAGRSGSRRPYRPVLDARGRVLKVVRSPPTSPRRDSRPPTTWGPDRRHRQVAGRDRVRPRWHDTRGQRQLPRGGRLFAGRGRRAAPPDVRPPEVAASAEYQQFWAKLARRVRPRPIPPPGRDGREIWIEASYNPIPMPAGGPSRS